VDDGSEALAVRVHARFGRPLARGRNSRSIASTALAEKHHIFRPRAKSVFRLLMEGGTTPSRFVRTESGFDKLGGPAQCRNRLGKVITAMGNRQQSIDAEQTLLQSPVRPGAGWGCPGLVAEDRAKPRGRHGPYTAPAGPIGLNHVGYGRADDTRHILAEAVRPRPPCDDTLRDWHRETTTMTTIRVVMAIGADPVGGPKNWSAGVLPATFEGTQFRTEGTPIFHLRRRGTIGEKQQRANSITGPS